jgi:hypothetical protein
VNELLSKICGMSESDCRQCEANKCLVAEPEGWSVLERGKGVRARDRAGLFIGDILFPM